MLQLLHETQIHFIFCTLESADILVTLIVVLL